MGLEKFFVGYHLHNGYVVSICPEVTRSFISTTMALHGSVIECVSLSDRFMLYRLEERGGKTGTRITT